LTAHFWGTPLYPGLPKAHSRPVEERREREARLREIPASWAREDAVHGISAYEALQPPLYYWLMAPVVSLLKNSGLLEQVMVLRWVGVLIASFAVPLSFLICWTITRCDTLPLGCAAVVAVMPGFAISVARVSNEPLSILLFTLLIWVGLRVATGDPDIRSAVALGVVSGLGLLAKAYFLTAVPAVLFLLSYKGRRDWMAALATLLVTTLVAGWWYIRNMVTTGTLSGLAEPIMLHDRGLSAMLTAIPHIPWFRAIDVILASHLYYCGWSALTVRSWIYHVFFASAMLAGGLILRMRGRAVLWLLSIYGFFWVGQLYNVVLQYLTKGLAGSMGWYLYAVVGCEVVLCALAFGRFRVWAVAIGTILFGLLDIYGMHCLAIPYYTGIIGHRANGALAALHMRDFQAVGFAAAFERLAANKCAQMSQTVLIVLWMLYSVGTMVLMALMVVLAAESKRRPLENLE
jgi:hypothetical protein